MKPKQSDKVGVFEACTRARSVSVAWTAFPLLHPCKLTVLLAKPVCDLRYCCVCQVVQECVGFKTASGSSLLHRVLLLVAGGLVWLLAVLAPCKVAWLLHQCPLQLADYALVKVILLLLPSCFTIPWSSCQSLTFAAHGCSYWMGGTSCSSCTGFHLSMDHLFKECR